MSTRGAGHAGGRHTNDNLLHLIAENEQELESRISHARGEAEAMVRQARVDAETMLRQARIQRDASTKASHEVDTLRRSAQAKTKNAVRGIIDRVTKGS